MSTIVRVDLSLATGAVFICEQQLVITRRSQRKIHPVAARAARRLYEACSDTISGIRVYNDRVFVAYAPHEPLRGDRKTAFLHAPVRPFTY